MASPSLTARLPHIAGLQCVVCGQQYDLDDVTYTCPDCGEVGTLDVVYHAPQQRVVPEGPLTLWRQRGLLPLVDAPLAGLQTLGGTPLVGYAALQHLAAEVGVAGLCIKNDGLLLTGSLKDRASSMVVQHAVSNLEKHTIATASTGNAAAALAGCCAAVPEAAAVIFVPATAPQAKIAQMLIFGARVILVDDDYDTAFDLCSQACEAFNWYNRSTGINPFTTEGKKTVIFEVAEQLDWQMPDVIMVSIGDGSIIGGVHKGCRELYNAGWVDKIPRLIGVQSTGSNAIAHAWENDLSPVEMTSRPANTIADSISSRLPRDRAKALRAVRETHGAVVQVDDTDILAAIPRLALQTGIFAEPAAAATFAGLNHALSAGYIHPADHVLLLITGNGLKDVQGAMQAVHDQQVPATSPTLEAVRRQVEQWDRNT